jgi:hypothetical protein
MKKRIASAVKAKSNTDMATEEENKTEDENVKTL